MNTFQYKLDGGWYTYFSHHLNCGNPGSPRTERTAELALADYWLNAVDGVCEVGAVSPYYWPDRVQNVIDPGDNHPSVTSRTSLFDHDFTGRNVLCVSTIEHVGTGEYGVTEVRTAPEAIAKIVNEANKCLITVPFGWNRVLDQYLLSNETEVLPCTIRFLTRDSNDLWAPAGKSGAFIRYGGGGNLSAWANSLAIIEKGNVLI